MSHNSYAEQLNAMLDGELPATAITPLARHVAACPDCAKHLAELAALHMALQQEYPAAEVPQEFYEKINGLLDREMPQPPKVIRYQPRPVRRRIAWLAAGTAVVAMLAILLLPRQVATPDLMSVRDAALRGSAWQTSHGIPAGPAVAGFQLVTARSDIIAGHSAQVLTYLKDHQTIVLCIWSANGEPAHAVRKAIYKGMAINYWNDGKHEYWAATTGAGSLLENFVAAIKNT